MLFAGITAAPPDAILGLTEAFKADPRPGKINLGVGVYQDDNGKTPVLPSVKAAEKKLLETEASKTYLSISGMPEYKSQVQELLFGAGHAVIQSGRARTAHSPGGTGGLRVGAELIKTWRLDATVWTSTPTWANHPGIFAAAGFKTASYTYYHPQTMGLDYAGMLADLQKVPAGDVVVLHVCCHNPTGVDLTEAQWREVAAVAAEKGWFPFLDFAYQGFGESLESDRAALLILAEAVPELLVSSSFSKNFGLYRERAGALTLLAQDDASATTAFSHLEKTIRVIYSNPPAHGGLIVSTILGDAQLRAQWESEVTGMRQRIKTVRSQLVAKLAEQGVDRDFSFIEAQRGMFSFSGLTDEQVAFLKDEKAIYIVKGGRINVAGITSQNIDILAAAMAGALLR